MMFASPSDVTLATHAVNVALHGSRVAIGTRIELGLAIMLGAVRDLRPKHRLPVLREVARRVLLTVAPRRDPDQVRECPIPVMPLLLPAGAAQPLH